MPRRRKRKCTDVKRGKRKRLAPIYLHCDRWGPAQLVQDCEDILDKREVNKLRKYVVEPTAGCSNQGQGHHGGIESIMAKGRRASLVRLHCVWLLKLKTARPGRV